MTLHAYLYYLQEKIKSEFKNNGFEILKEKKIHISKEEAKKFYKVHFARYKKELNNEKRYKK